MESRLAREQTLLGRLKAWPTPARALVLGVAAALIVAYQLIFSRRPDLPDQSVLRVAFLAAAYIAAFTLSLVFVLRPAFRPPPTRATRAFVLCTAGLSSVVLGVAFEVTTLHPTAAERLSEGAASAALGCFLYGSVFAIALLAIFFALDRGTAGRFSQAPLASLAAGLVANLALFFHCAIEVRSHMLAGHATIGPVWGGLAGAYALWMGNRGRTSASTG